MPSVKFAVSLGDFPAWISSHIPIRHHTSKTSVWLIGHVYVGHGRIRELVGMVYGETGPMRMKWNTKYILAIKKCQNNHSSNTQYIKSSTKDDTQVNLT